jgi:hypothetical protein
MLVRAGELASLPEILDHLRGGCGRPLTSAGQREAVIEAQLSFLEPKSRHALSRSENSARGHPGAGDFLDLAGGARSVVYLDALPEPQIDDVLLARHLFRHGRCCQYSQRQSAGQHQRKTPDV